MKRILILLILVTSINVGFSQDKLGFGNMPEGVDSAGFGTVTTWVKPSSEADSVYLCGEWYKTVTIGTQTWLQRNLHCTDGGSGIYCPNGNCSSNQNYGYLYTLEAALRIDSSIDGYHIPTLIEATELFGILNLNFNQYISGYYDLITSVYYQFNESSYWWTSTSLSLDLQEAFYCDFGYTIEYMEGGLPKTTQANVIRLIKD